MRASHGGSADGAGSRVGPDPRRENVDTWSEDIDNRSVVGERSTVVVDVNGTDGDSERLRCWRVVGGVGSVIAGCDDDGDTLGNGVADGSVQG